MMSRREWYRNHDVYRAIIEQLKNYPYYSEIISSDSERWIVFKWRDSFIKLSHSSNRKDPVLTHVGANGEVRRSFVWSVRRTYDVIEVIVKNELSTNHHTLVTVTKLIH